MHLVDEDDRRAPELVARQARALDRLANVLHAGEDRGDRDELRIEGLRVTFKVDS